MRNKLPFICKTLIFTAVLISLVTVASAQNQEQTFAGDISRKQMEAQISFFNDALSEFYATTPDQAVKLWVKGDQTRNGVYKYSVSCDQLKQWLVNRWGEPEKNFWIIGGSSPWLTKYEILSKTNISSTEVQYVVQYQWATSAGPEKPSKEQLLVKKTNDKWCIDSVKLIEGYLNY